MKRNKLLTTAVLRPLRDSLKASLTLAQWRRICAENGRLATNEDG
jgi:hypothetical protein